MLGRIEIVMVIWTVYTYKYTYTDGYTTYTYIYIDIYICMYIFINTYHIICIFAYYLLYINMICSYQTPCIPCLLHLQQNPEHNQGPTISSIQKTPSRPLTPWFLEIWGQTCEPFVKAAKFHGIHSETDQNVPETMLRIPFALRLMVFEPYDSILKSTQT